MVFNILGILYLIGFILMIPIILVHRFRESKKCLTVGDSIIGIILSIFWPAVLYCIVEDYCSKHNVGDKVGNFICDVLEYEIYCPKKKEEKPE